MPTPHNAAHLGQIAKAVLMPGDPLRARFIAQHFLGHASCFNEVRGMLGYTGTYHGETVSVMGSGMGIPSIGIYAYELYHYYDVETIIRIGSAGGIAEGVELRDLVFAQAACTDSGFAAQYDLPGMVAPVADFELLSAAVHTARKRGLRMHVGSVVTSDVFYAADTIYDAWAGIGCLAIEMECAGLYLTAQRAGKRALGMFTISDLCPAGRAYPLSSEERERGFNDMIEVALEVVREL